MKEGRPQQEKQSLKRRKEIDIEENDTHYQEIDIA